MIHLIKKRVLRILFSISLLLLAACSVLDINKTETDNRFPVKLLQVVDGDTIKVQFNGKQETVRLLLVDTPESVHPYKPVQPFSKEASRFTESMLANAKIELELDVGERDKYGRLLAYVYADGKSVQEALLLNGLARVAYVFAPNTKYADGYRSFQKQAQTEGAGIWSMENYVLEEGFQTNDGSTEADKEDAPDCRIKGNINSSGEKIYHIPEGRYYNITKPEEWFCTEQEAIDSGFRQSQQ
jgi:micrococcal nuclease